MHMTILYTTCPSADACKKIADVLINEKLVACANITPHIMSVFLWDGAVQTENEAAMILKTTPERAAHAAKRLRELHPYEVPAIMTWSATSDNDAYSAWVNGVLS